MKDPAFQEVVFWRWLRIRSNRNPKESKKLFCGALSHHTEPSFGDGTMARSYGKRHQEDTSDEHLGVFAVAACTDEPGEDTRRVKMKLGCHIII